MLDYILFW